MNQMARMQAKSITSSGLVAKDDETDISSKKFRNLMFDRHIFRGLAYKHSKEQLKLYKQCQPTSTLTSPYRQSTDGTTVNHSVMSTKKCIIKLPTLFIDQHQQINDRSSIAKPFEQINLPIISSSADEDNQSKRTTAQTIRIHEFKIKKRIATESRKKIESLNATRFQKRTDKRSQQRLANNKKRTDPIIKSKKTSESTTTETSDGVLVTLSNGVTSNTLLQTIGLSGDDQAIMRPNSRFRNSNVNAQSTHPLLKQLNIQSTDELSDDLQSLTISNRPADQFDIKIDKRNRLNRIKVLGSSLPELKMVGKLIDGKYRCITDYDRDLISLVWFVAAARPRNTVKSVREVELSKILLPSSNALEEVAVKILDALIKRGQMAMAESAFRTQLEVLRKVDPQQYRKYKRIPVERLAAEAVMQQAGATGTQPPTGNRLIDMLHQNGIPIGTSLKGIEQAIKTHRDIEQSDPTEQIAKAILEKVQKQILPGLVANIIAGRNPFQIAMPGQPEQSSDQNMQQRAMARMQRDDALQSIKQKRLKQVPNAQSVQYDLNPILMKNRKSQSNGRSGSKSHRTVDWSSIPDVIRKRLHQNPRLASLFLKKQKKARQQDEPLESRKIKPFVANRLTERKVTAVKPVEKLLSTKNQLVLGSNDQQIGKSTTIRSNLGNNRNNQRRSPSSESRRQSAIDTNLEYQTDEILSPNNQFRESTGSVSHNSDIHYGVSAPRPIPQRPRIMLPLTIGVPDDSYTKSDPLVAKSVREPFSMDLIKPLSRRDRRLHQTSNTGAGRARGSRVLNNLRNNPSLAGILDDDGSLIDKFNGPGVLSQQQYGETQHGHTIVTYPRLLGPNNHGRTKPVDYQVKQIVEERPIPRPMFIPEGRHTRIRLTGATEKEIPGLGGRFIIPSLDPTLPAFNTALHTQGRLRDEYDSILKLPNEWRPGNSFGLKTKTRTERLIGGNGAVETPAIGPYTQTG